MQLMKTIVVDWPLGLSDFQFLRTYLRSHQGRFWSIFFHTPTVPWSICQKAPKYKCSWMCNHLNSKFGGNNRDVASVPEFGVLKQIIITMCFLQSRIYAVR
jgi:hypothetical protein